MKPERWRLFVAVPIGDDLRRDLAAAVEGWRKRPDLAGLRWTDPESWHVTLAFLGLVDSGRVAELCAGLDQVAARHEPMRFDTGRLGAFPNGCRARVAWYGVLDPRRRLESLAGAVQSTLDVDGRPFQAHVTLGRARHAPMDVMPWLADAAAPNGVLRVDRVELVRSHTGAPAARYELIVESRLGERSRV